MPTERTTNQGQITAKLSREASRRAEADLLAQQAAFKVKAYCQGR